MSGSSLDTDRDDGAYGDDVRLEELQSLEAIFDPQQLSISGYSGCIEIPIQVDTGVIVKVKDVANEQEGGGVSKSKTVAHLSPLLFTFSLPSAYPDRGPPLIDLQSSFLPQEELDGFLKELYQLWRDYKDQILFTMIDHLQQNITITKTLSSSSSSSSSSSLPVIDCGNDWEKYDALVTFHAESLQKIFNSQTFTCQICQDDYKGAVCTQFSQTCNHIFCNRCLYDYFSSLIIAGEVSKVHCPDFECTREHLKVREKYMSLEEANLESFNIMEFRDNIMRTPVEVAFLTAVLERGQPTAGAGGQVHQKGSAYDSKQLVERYVKLFMKQQYDLIFKIFPTRVAPCPRTGCEEQVFRENLHDPLVICRKCGHAFCCWCRNSWHGTITKCNSKRGGGSNSKYSDIPIEDLELWLSSDKDSKERLRLGYLYGKVVMRRMADEYHMDKLFHELIHDKNEGFQKCPTCDMVVQRLDGCNKMLCQMCNTFFCYICGIYLERDQPYAHFNKVGSSCYGKLFEGMPGIAANEEEEEEQ